MPDSYLTAFYEQLSQHLNQDPSRKPLGGLSLFHSYKAQTLRQVPINLPSLIWIVSGEKRLINNQQEYDFVAGDLLLLPSNSTLFMENKPCHKKNNFLSVALSFSLEALKQFNELYGSQGLLPQQPIWQAKIPKNIRQALMQWFEFCRENAIDSQIAQHRQVEFLLLLAQSGLAGNILLMGKPSWKSRITQIISSDLAYPWKIEDISQQLSTSESSLRRRLQQEGTNFRTLLEEIRLTSGLALLQETFWPINQVADSVGYQSQSRFSERFKQRFGMSPSELRKTRLIQAND